MISLETFMFAFFHTSAKKEIGKKLKCIGIYKGGEYEGPIEQYCHNGGIRLERWHQPRIVLGYGHEEFAITKLC